MRVLFTTAWYPNRKVAGDGVFIQKHARAVARLNDVAVLMVQTDEKVRNKSIDLDDVSEGEHLHVALVYVPKIHWEIPVLTGLLRLAWLLLGYLKGYRYLTKKYWQGQRPEVCHVNVLTRAAMLPLLLKKLYGIPYIITEHWSRYRRSEFPYNKLQLWATRWAVREARHVCPVSRNLEEAMKGWKLDNRYYTRVGNVVDTDTFALPSLVNANSSLVNSNSSLGNSNSPLGKDNPLLGKDNLPLTNDNNPSIDQRVCFVHVSWMRDDSKNISGILRVLSRLKEQRQDWHLNLVGEGNDKEQLIGMAASLGLTDATQPAAEGNLVSFCPAVQGEALAKTLASHDALLMFSNYENQPVSVLEALSCGLPVIATAVGDIPLMLAGNRGITVPPGDEEKLYEVLAAIIEMQQRPKTIDEKKNDATLRESRHRYVVGHHSPEVIARQFDVLYASSLPSGR